MTAPKLTPRQREYLRLFRAGLHQAEIARRLRVGRPAVNMMARQLVRDGLIDVSDIRIEDQGHRHTADDYLRELRSGRTEAEVAARLGVTRGCVGFFHNKLRRQGLLP